MRTTRRDLGLWSESQVVAHRRLTDLVRGIGSVPAVQLGVAGRKSSHGVPGDNSGTRTPISPEQGGWQPLAPSELPVADLAEPRAMSTADIDRVLGDLERAAHHAHRAGYEALGLQGANGYLFHQFLSPLSNRRTDAFGGDLEGRLRFPLAVVRALRAGWPDAAPLILRFPASDLLDGGLTPAEVDVLVDRIVAAGVDVVDINAGGLTPDAPRPAGPLENARYARRFRRPGAAVVTSGAVASADQLSRAVPDPLDAVFVGRALLRHPYWALRVHPGAVVDVWPRPYQRAF